MKTIQITSSGSCEQIENFIVTDELYERFVSEYSNLNNLELDELQEELIRLYDELLEYAQEIEIIKCIHVETPEYINNINCFS
jgi:hypothetical protein